MYCLSASVFGIAAALTGASSATVLAVVSGVFALVRYAGAVSISASVLTQRGLPTLRIAASDAKSAHYAHVTALGPKNLRISCFVIEGQHRNRIGVPTLGYTQNTRRELFQDLERWLRTANLQLDEHSATHLKRLQA